MYIRSSIKDKSIVYVIIFETKGSDRVLNVQSMSTQKIIFRGVLKCDDN